MANTRKITNGAIRSYKLPVRTGPDGKSIGARLRLHPGQTIEVPAWYFDELLKEPGWRKRMDAQTGIVRGMKGGPGGHFESTIKMKREARAKAEAQERARTAEGQVSQLEQRLAALERGTQAQASAAADADARAKAAEARVAELEAELAKARAKADDKAPKK